MSEHHKEHENPISELEIIRYNQQLLSALQQLHIDPEKVPPLTIETRLSSVEHGVIISNQAIILISERMETMNKNLETLENSVESYLDHSKKFVEFLKKGFSIVVGTIVTTGIAYIVTLLLSHSLHLP